MKDSKNLVIGLLCTVLCIMAVAYAAFSTSLTINGTASVDSTWGVAIQTISCDKKAGVTGGVEPTVTTGGAGSTTATINASFNQPGDNITCTVTIANTGTLEAKLDAIRTNPADVEASNTSTKGAALSDFIWFHVGTETTDAKAGDALAKNGTHTYTIKAEYKDVKDANNQSVAYPKEEDGTPSQRTLVVDFDYVQNLANN